jgi:hypothetical protein
MRPNFNYRNVPKGFGLCFMAQCPQADTCMRRQVTPIIPSNQRMVEIINPSLVNPDGNQCPHYLADETVRFALGLTHLYDKLEYDKAVPLKQAIISYMTRNTYYRCWRKERLITPEEQTHIRRLFKHYGVDKEPEFDEYVERYSWESTNLLLSPLSSSDERKSSSR